MKKGESKMHEITVVELNKIVQYPPVQNLIRVLLEKGYKVNFIGQEVECIADDIKQNGYYTAYETTLYRGHGNILKRVINRIYMGFSANKKIDKSMETSDCLWISSMKSLGIVGKKTSQYKTIVQLMELCQYAHRFRNHFKLPVKKYAQKAYKVIVPEINRAYIQKIWWDLTEIPVVLPNKPYNLEYGEISEEISKKILSIKKENRKIILYLGGIYDDRDFERYAKAIHSMDGYVLYIIGKVFSTDGQKLIEKLQKEYGVVYLGGFNPPKHLAFVQYANIGLLPYKTIKSGELSELNALYCAPNKIWEYAGFGVPMVGSDVLGLKLPFEQWNIGRCCDLNDETAIIKAIEEVDRNHDEMSKNCYRFYDSVSLEKIVSEILEDEK